MEKRLVDSCGSARSALSTAISRINNRAIERVVQRRKQLTCGLEMADCQIHMLMLIIFDKLITPATSHFLGADQFEICKKSKGSAAGKYITLSPVLHARESFRRCFHSMSTPIYYNCCTEDTLLVVTVVSRSRTLHLKKNWNLERLS